MREAGHGKLAIYTNMFVGDFKGKGSRGGPRHRQQDNINIHLSKRGRNEMN